MEMTKRVLQDICKHHNLYRTPHLNDKLYLNFQGFSQIENLEPYYGVKALFLEGNALSSVDGLPQLDELKCLYLQQNRIRELGDLSFLPVLSVLNISNNSISSLVGLRCPQLETLICTHNVLTDFASIEAILDCPLLQTVDLQNNKIEDPTIADVFAKMTNLKCLYLKGNSAVSKIKQCRKQLISRIPTLTYLDDRPVFPNEREIVEAWSEQGLEGERKARDAIALREKEQNQRNFDFLQAIRAEAFREKRERLGLPPGDSDPALDEFSDTEWDVPEDAPELVDARSKLDMHMKHISDQSSSGSELISAYTAGDGQYMEASQDGFAPQSSAGITAASLNPSLEAASRQLNKFAAQQAEMPPLEALPQQASLLSDDLD